VVLGIINLPCVTGEHEQHRGDGQEGGQHGARSVGFATEKEEGDNNPDKEVEEDKPPVETEEAVAAAETKEKKNTVNPTPENCYNKLHLSSLLS